MRGDRSGNIQDEPGQSDLARVDWLERTEGTIVPLAREYATEHVVPRHRHTRAQLLHALTGIVTVTTDQGRWMVPPNHALWIPSGVEHAVAMHGRVSMRSIYVKPEAIVGLPREIRPHEIRVLGLTDLMRGLIGEAVKLPARYEPNSRAGLIMALIIEEIPCLSERPLGLPLPADPRLAALCRRFLAVPSPHETIDAWASSLAMSRRAFTRAFRRETGLSFLAWRQQACLFAALPRLAAGEPVTSVALDLGYESVSAFTTMFKRGLGAPPSRYLRETPPPVSEGAE
ncbi:AraC family transcriptional regulator [Skermanella stibiiresistens SB22]|uniref:AraC family transcriptional regulator n=1 Tax=Skermanella stibiiresistens SB22 TaxID=1385369 RepID=W9H9W9_9PROT|nr:helix-turn-helix transcriptional regulator [Skermanella stibiiresistens]EWY41551.1 AraC family transcriptional regulator [Skermanella stibiiresistens SB22]